MVESRLGVGRKFHHRKLMVRWADGGVSALFRTSSYPWTVLFVLSSVGNAYPWRLQGTEPGFLRQVQAAATLFLGEEGFWRVILLPVAMGSLLSGEGRSNIRMCMEFKEEAITCSWILLRRIKKRCL